MAKKKNINENKQPRTRKAPEYKSFRLSKRIKPAGKKPLPGVLSLCRAAIAPFKKNKKLFLGIIFIHFFFTVLFASGIASSIDFVSVKDNLAQTFGTSLSKFTSSLALLTYVFTSASGKGGAVNYQIFMSLIVSLSVIWSIRQVMAGEKITVRQAFYRGTYPLIPFIAVLSVVGIQLIPALIGNLLISLVLSNGIAIYFFEKVFCWLIFILLLTLSFYMVLSSLFGLYISTLPDMTPMKALRSARGLVLHRRLSVALRLVCLLILVIAVYGLVLVPLIFILPIAVVPAFLLLNSFNVFFINSYLYNLYRELL